MKLFISDFILNIIHLFIVFHFVVFANTQESSNLRKFAIIFIIHEKRIIPLLYYNLIS